jgi:hypothetical protein
MDEITEQHVKEWETMYSKLKNTVPTDELTKEFIQERLKSLDTLLERARNDN